MKDKDPDNKDQEMPDDKANQGENQEEKQKKQEKAPETPENGAEVADLKKQLDEVRNKYLYLLSDFENFRRNVAKERIELQQTAGRDIVTALLPVLDDFDRAAKNNALTDGIALIHQKLQQTLQAAGLKELHCAPGDEFNPDTQEAVAEIPAPSKKMAGKIVDVVEKGYQLGERIIRYNKVVVGK